ncbi:type 1 glutamine amidotransferase [Halomarina halobia]|uniref:Type 1 glutamine amidotransferase n=2 Tax=Halomarina halobia TaxID=3033386 RepID=A0ABD6ACZ0_9EURY|nr:type 1 glutamine amidotransferase [Halomarina sp. PSR21]
MILVMDNEVRPGYRYLAPEIARFLPTAEYRVYVDEPFDPDLDAYEGIVISGSTASVYDEEHADWVETQADLLHRCIDERVPVLGICFGHQLINRALGGRVDGDRRRATFVEMSDSRQDEILEGVNPVVPVLHADVVTECGKNMIATARTDYNDYFCTRHENAPVWTVQFHPEFTERVAGQPSDWNGGNYSFDQCNATRVLRNFGEACSGV